ncbi:MAG: alpha/beta hydrolase [Gemmobacter sp.]|jgi:acetyl esterase|nr:alpha/beta hydrolase [Gemmobacter sp.]
MDGDPSAPDWINGDPAELRRWRDARPEVVSPVLPDDVAIAPLPPEGGCPGGLAFLPEGEAAGVPILYFHGGGFIVGSPETHRVVAAWIAHITRVPVFSIRYRLAPEHPLPAQADDAIAAIRRRLRTSPRLRLTGDSAGGMVALWGHAGLTAAERKRIAGAVLFYPGGSSTIPLPEGPDDDESSGLGPKSLAAYQRRLDPEEIAAGNPAYDPMATGFALPQPTVILGAGADPVLYTSTALAALPGGRLIVAAMQGHGFLSALPAEPVIYWLRLALKPSP